MTAEQRVRAEHTRALPLTSSNVSKRGTKPPSAWRCPVHRGGLCDFLDERAGNGDGRRDRTGPHAVEPQEDAHGEPGGALVAVDQRVIAGDGVQQCRRLLATVSAAPMGEGSRAFLGQLSPVPEQIKTLEAVAQQRTAEANGAAPVYAPFVPETLEEIDDNTPDLLREGYDYHRTPRGQHPHSKGRFLLTSLDKMYAFSAFDQIPELLTQPNALSLPAHSSVAPCAPYGKTPSPSSPPAPGQPRDGHAGAARAAPGGCDRARLAISPGPPRWICRTGAPPREPPQPGP